MNETTDNKQSLDAEALVERLEKQLDEMETAEILRSMTPEELAEKGFIGDKAIAMARSANRQEPTEKEHLVFESGIEYERYPDSETFENLSVSSLMHIDDVKKDQLIACRSAAERIPFDAGRNVAKYATDTVIQFRATLRGKPVIIKDALYIVPSDVDCRIKIRLDNTRMHAYLDASPAYGSGKPLCVELVHA